MKEGVPEGGEPESTQSGSMTESQMTDTDAMGKSGAIVDLAAEKAEEATEAAEKERSGNEGPGFR